MRVTGLALVSASIPRPASEGLLAQVCGGFPDAMGRCAQLLDEHLEVDFVDINMGCPIDLVCNKYAQS